MKTILTIAVCLSLAACAAAPPPPPSAPTAPSAPSQAQAAKPDLASTKLHLEQHVKYPASRKEILAACADTPEFTAGQKLWFDQNLPEGKYKSAGEVMAALKL